MIASGAKVLGPITVGDNSKIGAGAVVIEEVPPNCTVVGVPGRIVKRNNVLIGDMDQISMPDPIANELNCLQKRMEDLELSLSSGGEQPHEIYKGECENCASYSSRDCSGKEADQLIANSLENLLKKKLNDKGESESQ